MPAHNDSDVGIRLGIGARFGASSLDAPPRSFDSTPSISPSTLSCRRGTGLGLPVVPDVNEIAATPGGDAGASASRGPVPDQVPWPGASTTGTPVTRDASPGRVTIAAGRSSSITCASSPAERRGLRGT